MYPVIVQDSPLFQPMNKLAIQTICNILDVSEKELKKRVLGRPLPDGGVIYAKDGVDMLYMLAPKYTAKTKPEEPNLTTITMSVSFLSTE